MSCIPTKYYDQFRPVKRPSFVCAMKKKNSQACRVSENNNVMLGLKTENKTFHI